MTSKSTRSHARLGFRARGRALWSSVVVATLVVATAISSFVVSAAPASAASAFACDGTVYSLVGSAIYGSDPTTGTSTLFANVPASGNALAITKNGTAAYWISGGSGTSLVISRYDAVAGTTSTFTGTGNSSVLGYVGGGINPVTGIYYYTAIASGGVATLFAFNTNTNTNIGKIGTTTLTASASSSAPNGDLAFDSAGNLYFASTGTATSGMAKIAAPLPTTAGSATLTNTFIGNGPAANGIAFGNDGFIYAEGIGGVTLTQTNPVTGAGGTTVNQTFPGTGTDLASCNTPPALTVQKNVVNRNATTDEFKLTATGGSIPAGTTATTTGSSTGVQAAVVGPVLTQSGTTYTLTEAAAGTTTLANYASTYSCIDTNNANNVVATGSGASISLPYPTPVAGENGPNVVCTFTNGTVPKLLFKKALSGNRSLPGDQFTVDIRTGSATGPIVNPAGGATTTGTLSTVTAGTGTTGTVTTTTGTSYFLTEEAAGTTVLANYNETITCTDANGVQTGLPSGAAFNGSVTITPVTGANITCTLTNAAVPASLSLTKTANPTTYSTNGSSISYSFLVTNTGPVPVTGLAINDTFTAPAGPVPTITCPATTLASGASTTCTATYASTQADFDKGTIKNSATATALDPNNVTVTSTASTATVTSTGQSASLSIAKSASPSTVSTVGATITYTFVVKNTGNVTVTGVGVNDTQTAPAGTLATGPTCPAGAASMAPGATVTCTATYLSTAADLQNGAINDSAVATGKDANNVTVTSSPSTASVATTLPPNLVTFCQTAPSVIISNLAHTVMESAVQTTSGLTFSQIGTASGWEYNGIALNPNNNLLYAVSESGGATFTTPGHLLVIGADGTVVDLGLITGIPTTNFTAGGGITSGAFDANGNLWIANGKSNGGDGLVYKVNLSTLVATPLASQSAVLNGNDFTYASGFLWGAVNSSTTLQRLDLTTGTVTSFTPAGVLASGQFGVAWTYGNGNIGIGTNGGQGYQIAIANPASASPTFTLVSSFAIPSSNNIDGTACIAQPVDLQIVKTGPAVATAGATLTWNLTVTNNGPGASSGFVVNDAVPAAITAVASSTAGCTVTGNAVQCVGGVLAVNASTTITVTGKAPTPFTAPVTNTATVTGNESDPVSSNNTSSETVSPQADLSITKTDGVTTVGQGGALSYTVVVTNAGPSAANSSVLTDPAVANLTVSGVSCGAVSGGAVCPSVGNTTVALLQGAGIVLPTLPSGATLTFTVTGTVGAAATGSVVNTATVTPPATVVDPTPGNNSATDTDTIQTPGLSIQKSATPLTVTAAGQTVSYSFLVTNTGNVPLTSVGVNDTFTAPAGPALTISCPVTTLAAGANTTCTASYTVTVADMDHGRIDNSATASGTPPAGGPITSIPSTVTVSATGLPAITIAKSAAVTDVNADGKTDLGDTIAWSFLVKNTGNVTLNPVSVSDAKAGTVSCPSTSLAPGISQTCVATVPYVITQADVDAGSVSNTATSSGTPPTGAPVTSLPSSTNTPVVQTSALLLTKSAAVTDVNGDGLTDLGDKIQWSFLVKNTGTVTITNVAVSDPTAGAVTCPAAPLLPNASTTCTATAPHTITQADVDAGVVSNTATATGKNPSNATVTSNPSGTDTPIVQSKVLALLKQASVVDTNADGLTDKGDTINWTFKLTNNGTVTLHGLTVTDPKAGTVTCSTTTLAPGASVTCTAVGYVITQADVDLGHVDNTANAAGLSPSGSTVNSAPSSTSTPVAQTSSLLLTKSAAVADVDGDGKTDLGDTIAWSFLVKNTGTTTITNVSVTDPTAGAVTCPSGSLAPNASVTCTANVAHAITQADVDLGHVDNTATATGKNPANATVTSNPSSTSTPVVQSSALMLTKSAVVTDVNGDGVHDKGDTIAWSFLVKNTGTTTISNLAVTDPKAGAVSCPVTQLAPNVSTTCTASAAHTIAQADVDAGIVSNTAVAAGTNPGGATVPSNPSSTDTPVTQLSALTLTKSAAVTDVNADGATDLGDTIQWSFSVKNTGTTTINNLTVADPIAGAVTCPTAPLLPGNSVTCTANAAHAVTQADVDAGVVSNTATAHGTNPQGADVPSNPSGTDTPVAQARALMLTKSAAVTDVNGDGKTDLGDTIAWSFLVKNTGTTTITNLSVSDPIAGAVTCPTAPLLPQQSTTCTATTPHVITQADVNAGVVSNTATAHGTDPKGIDVPSNPSGTDTPVVQVPALTLTKSAAVTDVNGDFKIDLGDTIQWSFLVKNTGTTTITNVTVNDPIAGAVTCPTAPLAPGDSTTCAANAAHVITQAGVDAGVVSNTAIAHGTDPKGNDIPSNPSGTDTPIAQAPALMLTKSAAVTDVNGNGTTDRGDTIAWSFLVKNTGTTTITNLTVVDPIAGAVTCPTAPLLSGDSTTCTANVAHAITQADVDAGVVSNTATAHGTDPKGNDVPSNPSGTDTPITQAPALTLTKSAAVTDVNGDGKTDLGDSIAWSFRVKNTGTTTISSVSVVDPVAGAVTCPAAPLLPGNSTTCTANAAHSITQADVDAGVVSNTATAHGTDPKGTDVPSNPSGTDTPVAQSPALTLTKSAAVTDVNGDGKTDLGDTIQWSFLVKNTGTTTITNVSVSDPIAGAVTCPATPLLPNQSTTCTANAPHTITQADVDAGVVSNTAIAHGSDPKGVDVPSNPSGTDTPIAQAPALTLTKSAAVTDVNGDGKTDLGDTIAWSFLVKNTGTTTIDNVSVSDPIAGAVTCPATPLLPNQSTTCTANAPHTITQADVDAGVVSNTAIAHGSDPKGHDVPSNPSGTDTPVAQSGALTVTKSAAVTDVNNDGKNDFGDTIAWSFLVKNTGTVTIDNLAVTDPKAGAVTCPTGPLAPQASVTCTANAPYTILQADVDAGLVHNTATASGTDPKANPVTSNPSSTDTPVVQLPIPTLTKMATVIDVNGDGKTDLGDEIQWSFLVKNSGSVTLHNVVVTDPKAGSITCPTTTLAPGASTTCLADAPYAITQADVDAGAVDNTAFSTAQDPADTTVTSNDSSTHTPVVQSSALTLTKSAAVTDVNGDGKTDLGDTIQWSFLVKNTGTTTIGNLSVVDPIAGAVTCPTAPLLPQQSTTCTANTTRTITQADVDAGIVSNTATAHGTDPKGNDVPSNPSGTDTPVAQAGGLTLTKSAAVTDLDGDGKTDLGDTIAWSFLVKNTGTTTITNLTVADPIAGAVTCPTAPLLPQQSTTCTADAVHTITQADVDAGVVSNTATAHGDDPKGHDVPSNPSGTDTPVAQTSALTLTKSAAVTDVNADGKTDLGDTIAWSFLVKNTGTTTIDKLTISDPIAGAVTCPTAPLLPQQSTTCTADVAHTITQADVDAGVVSNTATAHGTDPKGKDVPSNPSGTDTPVAQAPALSLTKSAAVTDVDGDGKTDLGDTIAWSFLVKNTGTTTIDNLSVGDPIAGAVTCPVSSLAPNASTTCTADATHTITQTNVDAGVVSNTAIAHGTDPKGHDVPSIPSGTDTPVTQTPALTLTKSAAVTDVDGDGKTDLGDTIQWSFLVENTGTTTIDSLTISDPVAGAVTCPTAPLAPGDSTTCTANAVHTITQTDVDAGFVDNTATAHGTDPKGHDVPSNDSSTHTPVVQSSTLLGAKHATVVDVNHDGKNDLGDTITYTVVVTNTGTVTLHALVVNDAKAGAFSCPVTTLAPKASTTCTASTPYTITQADSDAGHVDNTATVIGLDPSGTPVDAPPSTVSTPIQATSALALVKHATVADVNGDGRRDVGDTIAWTFTLTNTGSTTLSTLTVSDPTAGAVTCPSTPLLPKQSTTCTADAKHVITQADVDAGEVSNTATAAAVDPSAGTVISNPSSTDTALDQVVGLRLVKKGTPTDTNHDGRIDAGDHIAWTFTLTNTGLVTLHTITIADPKAGPVTCAATTLAPDASTTCSADNPYTITTTEANAGVVHNTATATGSCGCNATVKAVHAAAVVPTSKATNTTTDSVVPGLPFTGAMGVVWAVRGGIAALIVGAFLLLVARRRRDDNDPQTAL